MSHRRMRDPAISQARHSLSLSAPRFSMAGPGPLPSSPETRAQKLRRSRLSVPLSACPPERSSPSCATSIDLLDSPMRPGTTRRSMRCRKRRWRHSDSPASLARCFRNLKSRCRRWVILSFGSPLDGASGVHQHRPASIALPIRPAGSLLPACTSQKGQLEPVYDRYRLTLTGSPSVLPHGKSVFFQR